jgi:hypothetical protein
MQKQDKGTLDARTQSYADLTKPKPNVTRLQATQDEVASSLNTFSQRNSPFTSNVPIPPEMAGAYDTLKRDAYLRTGNMDAAKKFAADTLQRTWGQTSINGATAWMPSPPENFYSAPSSYNLTRDDNTQWMKQQLVDEFTQGGTALVDESAGPVADRLSLVPSNKVGPSGQPLYTVLFRDSLGNLGPAVDAQGRPMLWAPDWTTSAKKAELDAANDKALSDAKAKRQSYLERKETGLPATILGQMSEGQVRDYLRSKGEAPSAPAITPDYRAQGAPHPEYRGGTGRPDDIASELQSAGPEPAMGEPDEATVSPQSSMSPPSFIQAAMRGATDKELQTLLKQARSQTILAAAKAELARRGE